MRRLRGPSALVVGVALLFGGSRLPVQAAQPVGATGEFAPIVVSSTMKVLDLSTALDPHPPPNWAAVQFDDATWQPATPVWSDVLGCVRGRIVGWGAVPSYWGSKANDTYLFRQAFMVGSSRFLAHTVLTVGASTGRLLSIAINGQPVMERHASFFAHADIGPYLRVGLNVLAIYATPASLHMQGDAPCSALTFTLSVPTSGMTPLLPYPDAVSSEPSVPFTWVSVPDAVYYQLQIWLVRLASGQTIGPRSRVTFATQTAGAHYALDTQLMPRGTYRWRVAAANAQGVFVADWTPEVNLTLR